MPQERLSRLTVTDALDGLNTGIGDLPLPAPYRAKWAHAQRGHDLAILTGHTDWVNAVCAVRVDGQDLLASASNDGTVRLWDPATGAQRRVLTGHTGGVNAVCAVRVDGQDLLASASSDGTVRLWDPATGDQRRVLTGHTGWVSAVCAVRVDGQDLLASASERRDGAAVGPGHRRPAPGADRSHRRGERGVCGAGGRAGPAGLRRRRRDGAAVGPGHRG